ncbi:MAG: RNA methyltransferase [Desulfuromonadaceae bacterium]|nr:RNA methyltransferase [Desulfuromonadaceae bacterium]MDD5106785.1 RNA methyltransferase [Desulfuromonadaceae bacterium]
MACNNLAVALVHYPVYNKHHEVVTSALTNLDQHDIARSSKTFGLDRFYIVTPSEEQRKLAERISGHWQQGWGADYNPDRRQALDIVRVTPSIASAIADYQTGFSKPVKTAVTGAAQRPDSTPLGLFRRLIQDVDQPYLLLLGTGWGLTDECFSAADLILEPIAGNETYNHLSVRSAAAIMLDRLKGIEREDIQNSQTEYHTGGR